MKKLKYLFLIVFIFLLGIVNVNAENPPTDLRDDTVNSMTLYTYEEGTSVIMLDDKEAIVDVIDIINQKSLPTTQGGLGGTNIPYININYSTSVVKVEFYGGDAIVIDGVTYSSDYNGDVYEAIKSIFKLHGYSNPKTDVTPLVDLFKIDVKAETGNAGSGLYMNVVIPEGYALDSNSSYYVKFVNQGDPKPTDFPSNWSGNLDYDNEDISKWKYIFPKTNQIYIADDWYLLKGYDYAYFLSCDSQSCQVSNEPVKVNRPELPELSQRYHVFAFGGEDNTLDVFPYFPYSGNNGTHKLVVKIGIINDDDLLYSIYKNEADALTNLMKYAQENEGNVYTALNDKFQGISLEGLTVQNGAYYYIYTTLEDDNNMYRDLSDVSIAMGEANNIVNDVKWNFSDDIDNAKTGDLSMILIAGGAILTIGMATIAYRKMRHN